MFDPRVAVNDVARHEFEILNIDPLLRRTPIGGVSVLPAGEFTARGHLEAVAHPDLFPLRDALNDQARSGFEALLADATGFAYGDLVLDDVHVTGPRGLIIDRERRQILMGNALGWSLPSVELDAVDLLNATMTPDGTVRLADGVFTRPKAARSRPDRPHAWRSDPTRREVPARHGELELLMSPGFTVYGHWLVDVLIRLLAAGERTLPLIHPKPPRFAAELLAALGIALDRSLPSYPGAVVRADRLWVSTQPKFGRVLDRPTATHLWARLAAGLRRQPATVEPADLVYVSRSRWAQGRCLTNHAEVEAHMTARGYRVVHPQDLSIVDQAHLFAAARHVIGEDGSGLHNIVFGGESLLCSVIDLDRHNSFHASVANAAGHRIAHLAARRHHDGWELPIAALDDHLDAVAPLL